MPRYDRVRAKAYRRKRRREDFAVLGIVFGVILANLLWLAACVAVVVVVVKALA